MKVRRSLSVSPASVEGLSIATAVAAAAPHAVPISPVQPRFCVEYDNALVTFLLRILSCKAGERAAERHSHLPNPPTAPDTAFHLTHPTPAAPGRCLFPAHPPDPGSAGTLPFPSSPTRPERLSHPPNPLTAKAVIFPGHAPFPGATTSYASFRPYC
jgi:hypothetical protein